MKRAGIIEASYPEELASLDKASVQATRAVIPELPDHKKRVEHPKPPVPQQLA